LLEPDYPVNPLHYRYNKGRDWARFILRHTQTMTKIIILLMTFLENILANAFGNMLSSIFIPKEKNKILIKVAPESIENKEIVITPVIPQENQRIIQAVHSLNDRKSYNDLPLTPASICDNLRINDIEKIAHILEGKRFPDLTFINQFSEYYHIDKDWLLTGKDAPFSNHCFSASLEYALFSLIDTYAPFEEVIFFSANTPPEYPTAIALIKGKGDKYDYRIIHTSCFQFSAHSLGSGGRSKLKTFYNTIRRCIHTSAPNYSGRLIPANEYSELIYGKRSIHTIRYSQTDYRCEDFIDITHKDDYSNQYELRYGQDFIEVQEIIKEKIESI